MSDLSKSDQEDGCASSQVPQTTNEKLLERENTRQQELDRKRLDKVNSSSETEQASYFKGVVAQKQSQIESLLNALSLNDVNKADLPNQFDKINKEIVMLERYAAASTLFLKAYDIRRTQGVIESLNQTLVRLESELLPKKKFGFKSRKAATTSEESKKIRDSTDSAPKMKPPTPFQKPYIFKENLCGFSDKQDENLILNHETISKKDVSITNLKNCTVQMFGSSSTLTLISLENCKIFAGPVATSVFAEHCTNCTFVVPCQQLRVHDTKNTNFYIHVTSRAIIEDTTQVFFAPYNWQYDGIAADFKEAGLDPDCNHWNSVDDFNWLAVKKPSPNWSILNEEERVVEWDLPKN